MKLASRLQQLFHEAVGHHQAGRLDRAEVVYRQLALSLPRNARLSLLRGELAEQLGRNEEALRHFSAAASLDGDSAATLARLASALLAAGRGAEAEVALRRFTRRQPGSAEGWNILGFVLKNLGRIADALECHRQALERNPRLVEAWYHHGHTLASAGRNVPALASFDRALELAPGFVPARFGRAQARQKCGRLAEAIADFDAVLRAEPGHHEARSCRLYARQNDPGLSRAERLAEHRTYGQAVGGAPGGVARGGHDLSSGRRLRLAILSPDLRTHACAYFLEPLLHHLDPAEFELLLYHDHPVEDEVSRRMKSRATIWRNVAGRPHRAVEAIIRADRPDIAIDLAGHVGTSIRLPLFARRLAPVQVTYLGYPDTTGVAAMDFRLTDAIADPPGESDAFHTEQLVRFAPTAWAYQPPAEAPEVAPLPAGAAGPITFGCFSHPAKLTDPLLALWGRILSAVPDARLLLKGRNFEEQSVCEQVLGRLRINGIAEERIELRPCTAGTAEHLALYGRVDVALDTFPYHGTTTTCEALWMGVPVVTLAGDRHASRVGVSLLGAVGHPEWVAADGDAYVAAATALAGAREALAAIRAGLREEMRRSPLLDHAGQATRFAAALRGCWEQKRRGEAVALPAA